MGKHDSERPVGTMKQGNELEYYRTENHRLSKAKYRISKLLSHAQTTVSDQAVSILELEHQLRVTEQELRSCKEIISTLQGIIQTSGLEDSWHSRI